MRTNDIKVSTPEDPVLYAYGTKSISAPGVWEDPQRWDFHGYKPAFVLQITEHKQILALVATKHPLQPNAQGRATLEEAATYSLADYEERLRLLKPYSKPVLTDAERRARTELYETLRPFPSGWTIALQNPYAFRMFWSDYEEQLQSRLAEDQAARDLEKQQRKERDERGAAAAKWVKDQGKKVGFKPKRGTEDRATPYYQGYDSEVRIPLELAEKLIARAKELGW